MSVSCREPFVYQARIFSSEVSWSEKNPCSQRRRLRGEGDVTETELDISFVELRKMKIKGPLLKNRGFQDSDSRALNQMWVPSEHGPLWECPWVGAIASGLIVHATNLCFRTSSSPISYIQLPFDDGVRHACPTFHFTVWDSCRPIHDGPLKSYGNLEAHGYIWSASTKAWEQAKAASQRRIVIYIGWRICSKRWWSLLWFTD